MIFDKVKKVIVDQLDVDPEKVTMDSYFIDDLEADSLDVMEMIMEFENMFGVEVDEDSLSEIKQVGDVVRFFEAHAK